MFDKKAFRERAMSVLLVVLMLTSPLQAQTHPERTAATTWVPLFDVPPALPGDGPPLEEVWEDGRLRQVANPRLGLFLLAGGGSRACVVICPGGGYGLLSMEKEGYEVADYFNRLGMHAVVLVYRLKEFGYPAPLIDTTRAIRHLRSHAEAYGIDPTRIGIMGFSAGGHAAAMASTLFDRDEALAGDALDRVSARPDFSILIYPVISGVPGVAHEGSFRNLLGETATGELRSWLSLESRVGPDTPPTFLMHSADDASVPVGNALRYASRLEEAGIPFSLHVYPHARHGMGMREGFGSASTWPEALTDWLSEAGLAPTK